jgi:hypothetical protein
MSDETFNRRLAQILGFIIGTFGVAGLFTKGYLWEITNSDLTTDIFRIMVAATLLYVGFAPVYEATVASALRRIGVTYLAIGVAGIILPTLLGLMPSGLTRFDVFHYLIFGAIAAWAGKPTTARETT